MANAIDTIVDQVTERVLRSVSDRIQTTIDQAQYQAQARLDEYLTGVPQSSVPVPPAAKADARNRAGRTAIQGAVAAILVTISTTFATGISNDGVDLTSSGDWKVIAGSVVGAVVATGAAYVQRLVNPPKQ
jgi:GGDEF domain-containing protein